MVVGSLAVEVEIVLDEDDGLGAGEVCIGQVLQDMSVVNGRVAIGGRKSLAAKVGKH
jgi:hypothetical protein